MESLAIVFVYFFPTLVAVLRHKRSLLAIAVCNLFFALTIVGWIACLVWALIKEDQDVRTV